MTREDQDARDRAAIALSGPFRRRRRKRPFEVLDEAQETCERIAVARLLADDLSAAKAWARASALLNDRRKRVLR